MAILGAASAARADIAPEPRRGFAAAADHPLAAVVVGLLLAGALVALGLGLAARRSRGRGPTQPKP